MSSPSFVSKSMITTRFLEIDYQDRPYRLSYFQRIGHKGTLLLLHGLGGAKENFEWATCHPALEGYNLLSFDNPGTGDSTYFPDQPLQIDDLVQITRQFILGTIEGPFFLAGASMGGLTMLKYLEHYGTESILGLINIEGNLMPEDCMFSGKVIRYKLRAFKASGFQESIAAMRTNSSCGYQTIAHNIELNTDPDSYYHYSFQTVSYSASGALYDAFLALDLPRIFLHGDQNGDLSYLPGLRGSEVEVQEVPNADHFLFYDNPKALYAAVGDFIAHVENHISAY